MDEQSINLDLDSFTVVQEIRIQKRGKWSRTVTLPFWRVVAFLNRRRTIKVLACDRPEMQRYLVIDLGKK